MSSLKNINRNINIGNLALELFQKRDDRSEDNNYEIEKYIVHRYPKRIEDFRIATKRLERVREIKKKLNKLYEENKRILYLKKSSGGGKKVQNQERFVFRPEFQAIFYTGVEVSCRMISGSLDNYNIFRIGDIRFKGEMKEIMDTLLEKCKEEITTKFEMPITCIFSTAIYPYKHQILNCPLPCKEITRSCYNRHKHIFQSLIKKDKEDDGNNLEDICYFKRQLVGQNVIPYVAAELDSTPDGDDTLYVFDNMFLNKELRLEGIPPKNVRNDDKNFLDTVDSFSCNALISFSLSYIGVNNGGMNLYLDPKGNVIYCTKANNQNEIPQHASQYLEELCFSNDKLKNLLKTKKGIDLFAIEEDLIDIYADDYDEPKNKRAKIESDNIQEEEEEEEEEEEDFLKSMEEKYQKLDERNNEINDYQEEQEQQSVYEARRQQMIDEI